MLRACDDPRLLAGLRHSCGPVFMDALEDPEVIEIMLNPDGTLRVLSIRIEKKVNYFYEVTTSD